MKLLIDMNLSPRWAQFLSRAGFQAAHWSALGVPDAPDTLLMDYARVNGYVLLAHDLDFGAMLAASRSQRPSVVQLRAGELSPEAIGATDVSALHQMAGELNAGALLTIDTQRVRLRVLPFNVQ